MNFDNAYLNEYNSDRNSSKHQEANKYYSYKKAEIGLKNLLKYKYGKIMDTVTPEQIFQLEETGSKVLKLKHKITDNIIYAVVKYDNNIGGIKREIKQLGFKIARGI